MKCLDRADMKDQDLLFPTRDEAFAKNLRNVSQEIFNQRINPKTLRKLGVCIAEKLGYNRADIERIGGWAVNSPIIEHYFKRKGVGVIKKSDKAIEKELHSDMYEEFEKFRLKNKELQSQVNSVTNKLKDQIKKRVDHQDMTFKALEQMKERALKMKVFAEFQRKISNKLGLDTSELPGLPEITKLPELKSI